MKYLRGEIEVFETETYAETEVKPYEEKIMSILTKRQPDASSDWKAFAKELSGYDIPDFNVNSYIEEYKTAGKDNQDKTFLGKFILAALSQKSMVTNKIYKSGNLLAGFSVDYDKHGFGGIKDYLMLVNRSRRDSHEQN